MSLFRQGKEDAARKLASAAAATMKSLPKDENNPLAGNVTHDDLILWQAYKEAKVLIQFDAAPPAKADNDKQGSRYTATAGHPEVLALLRRLPH
jgi:hypothetical protein